MATKIEWAEETWNPIIGCSKISEGCQNCYAEKMACRLMNMECRGYVDSDIVRNGSGWTGKIAFIESALEKPFRWKRPQRIFVCSMGDLFHENVTDSQINSVFLTMVKADWHQYVLLTKRPKRMLEFMSIGWRGEMPHVMIGVTAENQQRADERIPILLQIPAAKRFVSVEPMLDIVRLDLAFRRIAPDGCFAYPCEESYLFDLDLVICGGETGPGARPMFTDWAVDLRDHCEAAAVPFFFKKHGDWWLKKFKPIAKNIENQLLDGERYQQWPV